MVSTKKTILRGGMAAVILGLVLPLTAVMPAQAAASCSSIGSDGTLATASCTGTGYVRLNVRCNAIWPFTPWTDTGPRVYLNGGGTIANQHISCGASLTVWVVYG